MQVRLPLDDMYDKIVERCSKELTEEYDLSPSTIKEIAAITINELLRTYEQTQTPGTPIESESSPRSEDATYFDNAIDSWTK